MRITRDPQNQPDYYQTAGGEKSRTPAETHRDPWNDERGNQRTDIRSTIEYAGGQRALLLWKPIGHCSERGREIGGLSKTQRKSRRRELQYVARQRMAHGRQTPKHHRD